MDEIEYLREQRKLCWARVKSSHITLMRARKLTNSLESHYKRDESEYEAVDRRLALLDGRFKVVTHEQGQKVTHELTREQLLKIAAALGINLNTEGIEVKETP